VNKLEAAQWPTVFKQASITALIPEEDLQLLLLNGV
jgi:hypothetical protein